DSSSSLVDVIDKLRRQRYGIAGIETPVSTLYPKDSIDTIHGKGLHKLQYMQAHHLTQSTPSGVAQHVENGSLLGYFSEPQSFEEQYHLH
ncbi:hypothetical protein T10_8077, partial [Trichinella papuae]